MSRFMLRLFLTLLFASVLYFSSASIETQPRASTFPHGFRISPTSGPPPLEIRVTGEIHAPLSGIEWWRIHWGNGDVYVWGAWWGQSPHITEVDTTYVYNFPGTYTVVREWESSDPTVPIFIDSTTVITVSEELPPPPPPPHPVCATKTPRISDVSIGFENGANDDMVFGYIGRLVRPIDGYRGYLTESRVDFDDGSETWEVVTWRIEGDNQVTEYRLYLVDGDHTATVRNLYDYQGCLIDIVYRTNFTTFGAPPPVPVVPTTWGRVKALYK